MCSYALIKIKLLSSNLKFIHQVVKKGIESARVIKRCSILEALHFGHSVKEIANVLRVSQGTVRNIAHKYNHFGLETAIYEPIHHATRPHRLTPKQAQQVVAMVCGPAPQGQARWSVRLIVREAIERKIVETVGRETIRVLLKEHDLKPWRKKNVVRRTD